MHEKVERLFEELAGRDAAVRDALKQAAHVVVDELTNYDCDMEYVESAVGDLNEVLSLCQTALAVANADKE